MSDEQPDVTTYPSRWHYLAEQTADLVKSKNAAYGNSFEESTQIAKLFYPQGVGPGQMQDFLAIIRVLDKLKRIATNKDAFGEDPWKDINGYSLLMLELAARGVK